VRSAGGEPRLTRERSRIERRPSLFADATIRLPERVVANMGGLSTVADVVHSVPSPSRLGPRVLSALCFPKSASASSV
jgi:hypothetical protein